METLRKTSRKVRKFQYPTIFFGCLHYLQFYITINHNKSESFQDYIEREIGIDISLPQITHQPCTKTLWFYCDIKEESTGGIYAGKG